MKTKTLIVGLVFASAIAAQASVTISGTSIVNAFISGTATGVYISSNGASFDEALFSTLEAGTSFTQYTAIGDYTVLGAIAVASPNATTGVLSGGVTFDLSGNISTGNEIGILIFDTSTDTYGGSQGDNYQIYTGDWLVASDGANASLTGAGPYTGASFGAGTVVPEPSTYAALAGFLALGCVALRRRK